MICITVDSLSSEKSEGTSRNKEDMQRAMDSLKTAIGILKEVRVCARCHETVIWIGGCPVCAGTEVLR